MSKISEDISRGQGMSKRPEISKESERQTGSTYTNRSQFSDSPTNIFSNSGYRRQNDSQGAAFQGSVKEQEHTQTHGFTPHDGYSVSKKKENNRERGAGFNYDSASSNRQPEKSAGNMEIVNSNRRSSRFKSGMKSGEGRTMEHLSDILAPADRSYSHRSSPASHNKRENEKCRSYDRETKFSQQGKSTHSDQNMKVDGKNAKQMTEGEDHKKSDTENQSSNNSRLLPDERNVSVELELTAEFQMLLQENKMHILKKKNQRFSKAKYHCLLCDFHLDTKVDCEAHIKDSRHCGKKKIDDLAAILNDIPEPSEQHVAALTAAVDRVFEQHGINKTEQTERADVVTQLEKTLKENVPDVLMFMYGSSLTGFGLKDADINVDLISTDKEKKSNSLLKEVHLQLKDRKDSRFSDVRISYTSKVPSLLLTDGSTGYTINITIHSYSAHCSSQLLSIYSDFDVRVRKLAVAFRYWAHICGLDRHIDGFLLPQAFNIMVIYFLQNLKPAVIPIIEPPKVSGDEVGDYRKDSLLFQKRREKVMKAKKANLDMSVGELWVQLLKFYCLEFDAAKNVVCIRQNQGFPRNKKPWNSKKLSVEDPFSLNNITSMINNPCVHEYWQVCLHKAALYFSTPSNKEGKKHSRNKKVTNRKNHGKAKPQSKVEDRENDGEEDKDNCSKSLPDSEDDSSSSCSYKSIEERLARSEGSIESPETQNGPLSQQNHYEFTEEVLTEGKGPMILCTSCEKEGHLKNACPEDELPEKLPLPVLSAKHVEALSETLNKLPMVVGLSEKNLSERQKFMKSLEEFIQGQYKDASLALFGSSCNGFGFEKSDMDICLTFTQTKTIDKPWLIQSLARRMGMREDITDVQPILTAKVPIVKFTVKRTGLEGDISLDNILAQQNTKLLHCYTQIDPRVSVLGYTIKNFTKVCDIGDASRGSLSSYAFVLMMLYYLQQVTPPVIPVLQELYTGKKKPELIIEGCDAWFMDDLSKLDKLWPEKGKNKMSVAELWLGFLRFYVEEFDFKELVISIRQKEPLSRFEKLWSGTCIAVEDPFDLSHNLGSGLTRKMNNFIIKTFINGRMLYGSPIDDNMEMFNKYDDPHNYFFDKDLLSECRPPNVRGCRHCAKIGHIISQCPIARRDKEEQKRLQQQQQQQRRHQQEAQQRSRQSEKLQQSAKQDERGRWPQKQQWQPQQGERQQESRALMQHPVQQQQDRHQQVQRQQHGRNQRQERKPLMQLPPRLQQDQQKQFSQQQDGRNQPSHQKFARNQPPVRQFGRNQPLEQQHDRNQQFPQQQYNRLPEMQPPPHHHAQQQQEEQHHIPPLLDHQPHQHQQRQSSPATGHDHHHDEWQQLHKQPLIQSPLEHPYDGPQHDKRSLLQHHHQQQSQEQYREQDLRSPPLQHHYQQQLQEQQYSPRDQQHRPQQSQEHQYREQDNRSPPLQQQSQEQQQEYRSPPWHDQVHQQSQEHQHRPQHTRRSHLQHHPHQQFHELQHSPQEQQHRSQFQPYDYQQQYKSKQPLLPFPGQNHPQHHHQHERNQQNQSPGQHNHQQNYAHQQPQFHQQMNSRQNDQDQWTHASGNNVSRSMPPPLLMQAGPYFNVPAHPPPVPSVQPPRGFPNPGNMSSYHPMIHFQHRSPFPTNFMGPIPPLHFSQHPSFGLYPAPLHSHPMMPFPYGSPPAPYHGGGAGPAYRSNDQMYEQSHSFQGNSDQDSEGNYMGGQTMHPAVQKLFDVANSQQNSETDVYE